MVPASGLEALELLSGRGLGTEEAEEAAYGGWAGEPQHALFHGLRGCCGCVPRGCQPEQGIPGEYL